MELLREKLKTLDKQGTRRINESSDEDDVMKTTDLITTLLSVAVVLLWGAAYAQSPKVDVNAVPRIDSITDHDVSDSRHNLGSLSNHVKADGTPGTDEVCVFCHTPHFSNASAAAVDAPLWNRNLSSASYTVYSSATMDTTPGQPDGRSIACLSCHDGTVALDSLINAPGPGGVNGYTINGSPNSTFTNNPAFSLNWTFTEGTQTFATPTSLVEIGDPRVLIGTDLSNDHPISMVYPTAAQDPAFNQPPGTPGSPRVFTNGIRTFDADKVQCPSCHDPHLGDTAAAAKGLRPFLRVSNTGSAVCLTCHIK